ncbi:Dihydroorotase [Streptococcus mitis]|uniref:Dihydroorotase n=1 Tax=Streptococcus mitis TaxID=28037 RepID=A0A150NVT9_STRMT|nr:Dihydroorotase [Streptococcus mitis]
MGKLSKIAPEIKEEGAEIIDATGLVVAPGLVDIHVHFREPGQNPQGRYSYGCPSSRCRWFYNCCHDG